MLSDTNRNRQEVERSLVGFHVGGGYYAVDVPSVREIVSPIGLVSVPHSSSIVLGVVDHRGRVVPIVDLRRRFGITGASESRRAKWIVVESQTQWFGLAVDDVTEVFSVTPAEERRAPRLGPDDVARGFSRVYVSEKQIVLVLDLDVLSRAVADGGGAVVPPSWNPPVEEAGGDR
jgi:purine-binding chemotaxis protein CheW